MQTFSSFRFPHAVLTSCAAVLLSLGGASPAAAAPSAGDTFPQDRQDLLKNKKYQQGLKALENRLPLEASKHFQECLSSQNLAESQKARSPDPRQKNGRRTECLGAAAGLSHEILLDGGRPLQ